MSDHSHYIGKTHTEDFNRDAIHIAISQVIAAEILHPGNRLEFTDNNKLGVVRAKDKGIGIADPFLTSEIKIGSKFFMFLYPNTVTSLSHQWTHPAFASETDKQFAERWLRNILTSEYDDNYGGTVEQFKKGQDITGFSGDDTSEFLNGSSANRKKFWDNLEILTGVMATEKQRERDYFSCSC